MGYKHKLFIDEIMNAAIAVFLVVFAATAGVKLAELLFGN